MASYPQIDELLRRAEAAMASRGFSRRTCYAYLRWIEGFLHFHRCPHPPSLTRGHAERFLEHLQSSRRLAAKTRNQAASAISFLYRELLGNDAMAEVARPRNRKATPVVLSRQEVTRVLDELRGKYWLVAALLYGTGMRLNECLSLRVKDLDFDLGQIVVRDGKGGSNRFLPMPEHLRQPLATQVDYVRRTHRRDRANEGGWAPLPGALHRKDPQAGFQLAWQHLFPASRPAADPATGRRGRTHLHSTAVQKEMRRAVRAAQITKPATCHSLRHSFATQMLKDGCDIRVLQKLMGHADVRTTMIYLHTADRIQSGLRTPIDRLIDHARAGAITPPTTPTDHEL